MDFLKKSIIPICILFSHGCISPDPLTTLTTEQKDLYITNKDNAVDFSNYKTYIIVDTVRRVNLNSSDTSKLKNKTGDIILNTVNIELQNDGFVKVNQPQNADVGVSVSVLTFEETSPNSFFDFTTGSGFSGYVSPSFFGFPNFTFSFPSYFQYLQISVGSIAIEMYDLKTARTSNDKKIKAIWSALMVGSITDSNTVNTGRIERAIISSFQQSPYLKEGK